MDGFRCPPQLENVSTPGIAFKALTSLRTLRSMRSAIFPTPSELIRYTQAHVCYVDEATPKKHRKRRVEVCERWLNLSDLRFTFFDYEPAFRQVLVLHSYRV